jgi:tetratricopeptide (TPR) repeat protein
MNPKTLNAIQSTVLQTTAHNAYAWGREADAARLYREAAEREQETGRIAAKLNARRWEGNSLMWAGQHDEALRVLIEVAACNHPEADPNPVYGAKTDCIMLSLFHARASSIKMLLSEARAYLDRIGRPEWRHRLDLLTSILLFGQGRLQEALQSALLANRLRQAAIDGPHYADLSHLKWITRPLFFLREEGQLSQWAQLADRQPITMLSDRLRVHCIRILIARLRRAAGLDPHNLFDDAPAAAATVTEARQSWDEVFEVGRALMLVGDWNTLERLPMEKTDICPFNLAVFVVDREINLLRRKLGLVPWDPDLNWPCELPDTIPQASTVPASDTSNLQDALVHLAAAARLEDQRLETSACSQTAAKRTHHARALLRAAGIQIQGGSFES